MSHDRSTVEAVVKNYFDGLYEGDADKLGAIFDTTADLRWLEKGELQVLTVPDWLDRVRKRPSAKAEGKPREDFIVTSTAHDSKSLVGDQISRLETYRHDRPLRRSDRLHQGALPVAAALFHRLSGGDETERRLEDRLEILPLRSARVIATQACAPAGAASVPPLRRPRLPRITRITTAGCSSRVGGASRLATSRKAVASFAS